MNEIEGREVFFFYYHRLMDKNRFQEIVEKSAQERGCSVVGIEWNDDDNIFDVTIDKADGDVSLEDCEHVHRAVLSAFDRNVEDYSLTVGSLGIAPEEADEMLKTINE